MAETKAKKAKPSKASANGKARSSSKPKRASASGKSKASKPKSASRKSRSGKPAPSKPQAALDTVEESAKSAGSKVGRIAARAKVPLVAGGAALAAGVGGVALGARGAHRKSGLASIGSKVNGKDLARAARKAGDVGAQIGEVALEVRRARESSNGNGHSRRSPIEVVLQGLTSRR